MTEAELRRNWESRAPYGCRESVAGLALLAECERLRAMVAGMAERIASQSAQLSMNAERQSKQHQTAHMGDQTAV